MEEAKRKAQATYNAAAVCFDDPANAYWDRYGRRTVERLQLPPGSSVLDVACGTGASALPAAEIVGPTGRVVGIDLAENLLDLARTKAVACGLQNIDFRQDDMTQLHYDNDSFDAEFSTTDVAGGSFSATLGQVRDAHAQLGGFGDTGEFLVGIREGDQIAWLLSDRDPVPL